MADLMFRLPEDVYAHLELKSARVGVSVEDYLLRVFERAAAVPTPAEMRERLAALPPWPTAKIVSPPPPEDDE
jgi:hypothetical protein